MPCSVIVMMMMMIMMMMVDAEGERSSIYNMHLTKLYEILYKEDNINLK